MADADDSQPPVWKRISDDIAARTRARAGRMAAWRRRVVDPRVGPVVGPVWTPAAARVGRWRENDPLWAAAREPGAAEKWALGVSAGLVLVIVVFLALFDWNWLRGPIGRWASNEYQREVVIGGDLDVNLFSWTPSATVAGLRIGGPGWAREDDTLRVERIEASVRLRKLFAGQIEMPLLRVDRPEAVLIATEDGKKSWELNPDKPDDGTGMDIPPIQRLIIRDGRLRLDEQRRGVTLDATVNAREVAEGAQGDDRSGFLLDGEGAMNGAPLTLTVRGGPFIRIRRDQPYEFTAELAGARSNLRAEGSVTRPFNLGAFVATLSLSGENLADLYMITGITTPNTPRYRLEGRLERAEDLWTFSDFAGTVGSSDLSGDLSVDKIGDRRRVEADLVSRSLDIDDLATVLGAQPQVTPTGTVASSGSPARLLPDAPLQVERLRSMDGRLSYRAGSVKRNTFEIRQVRLGAALDAGILTLDPVSFAFNRGTLNGTARIDANRDVPYSAIDFRLAGYPLESIIPARGGVAPVTGTALGRARLEGPGASIHDLASNARGSVSLFVPQGRMRAAFAELLGINVGAGLLKLLSGDQSTSTIQCAVADFTVAGGVATAKTLVIDTDVVLAKGEGTINLASETMNLRIDGESKRPRLLRLWTPITISGPLVRPRIGVDIGAVAAQGGLIAAIGAVVAPVAAVLGFVEPGLAEDANCGALIAGAR